MNPRYKKQPSLALVADWLTSPGGAEQVVGTWHENWSSAPIFTTIFDKDRLPILHDADVRPSYLQKFPLAKNHHQYYLGWMPEAVESFDVRNFNIVLSSAHACAKGVITKPETMHVAYCHTPPRYIWESEVDDRLARFKWPVSCYTRRLMTRLRTWDRLAADRVDFFLANSAYIASRIQKFYRRDATVIYPPVEVERFTPILKPENYYLTVGRLIAYKRFDLAIKACTALGVRLKVAGTGPELDNLKKVAGDNVEFLGRVPDEELPGLYAHANAIINPQVEDFGITSVEAQAAGRPVIALRAGGALETVEEGISGAFFDEQTVDSLAKTIRDFDTFKVNPKIIRQNALKFSRKSHVDQMEKFLETKWTEFQMGKLDPSLINL